MHFIVLKSFLFFINRYKILHDPKEWITINEGSGSVQTSKTLDREVITPKNELYNITVLAIDQGKTRVFIWDVTEELENKLQLFLGRITPVLCVCVCSVLSYSWDAMDCSWPGSSLRGIFQARILEWVAISFSRGSS